MVADTGALFHFRPDNYWVRPVDVSGRTFGVFLNVLAFYRWLKESEESLVGRAMYKPPTASTDSASVDPQVLVAAAHGPADAPTSF